MESLSRESFEEERFSCRSNDDEEPKCCDNVNQ